jgi:hypothetical protein
MDRGSTRMGAIEPFVQPQPTVQVVAKEHIRSLCFSAEMKELRATAARILDDQM